jgi:uncharacterized protein YheU (UPF0270 family)
VREDRVIRLENYDRLKVFKILEESMAIGTAVQRGAFVIVYNEKGRQLCTLSAGTGPNDGLYGFTGSSVSIRRGNFVITYNERGQQVSSTSAR